MARRSPPRTAERKRGQAPWWRAELKGWLTQPSTADPISKAEEAKDSVHSRLVCKEPTVLLLHPAAMKVRSSLFPQPVWDSDD